MLPWRPTARGAAALVLALPWVAWAVVRTFGLERGHPIVALVAFTPYVAATAWIPLAVAVVLRCWVAAAVAAIAALALVVAVAPRAFDGPQPALAGGRSLTVMTANLAYGKGDARTVMRLVEEHDVDVLSMQELTPEEARRLDRAGAARRFPYRTLDLRPGAQGTGIMARFPLRDPMLSPGTRLAMPEATLTMPGTAPIRIKAVHPVPPLGRDVAVWRDGLRTMPHATPDGGLRMLVGDFNATLDHEELRALIATGYVDAADASGAGLHGTYKSGERLPPPIAIDHVLVDRRIRATGASVHTVPGSDHRSVIATLSVPAAG